jgi:predicted nucleotide-binding protein
LREDKDMFTKKDKIIYELWKIIDDIDTASDIAKGNDKAYRNMVEKKQEERWKHISEKRIGQLFDKYYQ